MASRCCNSCKNTCTSDARLQPLLRPLSVDSDTNTHLVPSGPIDSVYFPLVTAVPDVEPKMWNGITETWTSLASLVRPVGGAYTKWETLIPPSTVQSNIGGVTGTIVELWDIAPAPLLLSQSSPSLSFFIAGTIGGVPTLALYDSALVTLTTVVLPGLPSHIAFDGKDTVAVSGQLTATTYYLALYTYYGLTLVLRDVFVYGVPVTSITAKILTTSVTRCTADVTGLLVTTGTFYLTGEIVTNPGPVLTSNIPPGDIFLLLIPAYNPALVGVKKKCLPKNVLVDIEVVWSDRYGGLASADISLFKDCIFALSSVAPVVVSWQLEWGCCRLIAYRTPATVAQAGVQGIYIVENQSTTQLIVWGRPLTAVYTVISAPL